MFQKIGNEMLLDVYTNIIYNNNFRYNVTINAYVFLFHVPNPNKSQLLSKTKKKHNYPRQLQKQIRVWRVGNEILLDIYTHLISL